MSFSGVPWNELLIAAVAGYLIGSVSPAVIAAKRKGIDLQASGSGNPGATNAARTLGSATGIVVGLIDVLKGVIPAVIFSLWFGDAAGETAAFAAVVGHITSPWLRGHGGKGAATTLGALLGTNPIWLLWLVPAFFLGYLIFRRVGMAVVVAAAIMVLVGLFLPDLMGDARLFGIALGLLVLLRHSGNIKRYVAEKRIGGNPDSNSTVG